MKRFRNAGQTKLRKSERDLAKPTGSKWLLTIAATIVALLCAEILLRCVWRNPFRYDQPDRIVRLRLHHANTDHPLDRSVIHPEKPITRLRTDERSYILPSRQHKDPDCKIAFLGGSTTECFAVDESTRFPALVSSLLSENSRRVSTMNAGLSGNTVHDSINNLLNHVAQDEPDIAVMMHACNDIGVLERAGDYRSRQGHYLGWSAIGRATLMNLTNYSYTLAIVRQVLRERTYLELDDVDEAAKRRQNSEGIVENERQFEGRIRLFVETCRAFGIQPVLMTQPIRNQFNELTPTWVDEATQRRFNQIVRRVSQETRAELVDLVAYIDEAFPEPSEQAKLFYDGLHVNDRGSRAYAEHIAESLASVVHTYRANPSSEDLRPARQLTRDLELNLRLGQGESETKLYR